MFKRRRIAGVIAIISMLSACSPRIVGTWNVVKYEMNTPEGKGIILTNIGTFEFNKDNSGRKDMSYNMLNLHQVDQFPFSYNWEDDKYITITGGTSDFAKTWIIVENKAKKQKWKSTDGANSVQILELEKQKKSK